MVLLYSEPLPEEWEAPDFHLTGTNGEKYSLSNFFDKKGLLIAFTCNHCPYAIASWPLLVELNEKFKKKLAVVAINPNDADTYTDDSFANMRKLVEEMNLSFPYLHDETQEIAKEYKAQCTPDLYLFKNEGGRFKLWYHGRITDDWQNPEKVKERNLEDAMLRLANDERKPENQPPSMGCSIKWK